MRILRTLVIAAAFLATATTTAFAAVPGAPPKTAGEYLRSGHFKVFLDGVPIAVEKIERTDLTNEAVDRTARARLQQRSGTLTLVRDADNSTVLYQWRKSLLDGRSERKSLSIVFVNDDGTDGARIVLHNCVPVKWSGPGLNAKSSGHATERIEISWETMEMK